MAWRDFFSRGSGRGGFFSWVLSWFKPAEPEPVAEPEEADDGIEIYELDDLEDTEPAEPQNAEDAYWNEVENAVSDPYFSTGQINNDPDIQLYNDNRKMLDTMVKRGYIQQFDKISDAAEFLRVLSSEAWNEAHAYYYSQEAFEDIQNAILRGVKAGALQVNYNIEKQKKSQNYLESWERWERGIVPFSSDQGS